MGSVERTIISQTFGPFGKIATFLPSLFTNLLLIDFLFNFFSHFSDSSHIVDHNLKLILGLVWTLILHYSLSHQHFTHADTTTSPTTITNGSDKKETPKQRLLAWIQGKIPGRRVANFTSTWNDGITLGALVSF